MEDRETEKPEFFRLKLVDRNFTAFMFSNMGKIVCVVALACMVRIMFAGIDWIGIGLVLLVGTALGMYLAGNRRHIPLAASPTIHNAEILVPDVRQDVEELRDKNWELREKEEQLQSLINFQGDIVYGIKVDGSLVFTNFKFDEIFPDAIKSEYKFALKILEEGPPITVRWPVKSSCDRKIVTPSGPQWFNWIEAPMRSGDGTEIGTYVIGRDISVQKKNEAANKAKSGFLATVSHEMRTPLNGVLGMANLLGDTDPTPEQATYIEAIETSGHALLTLIDDVLDFAKIEAGRVEIQYEDVDLLLVLEEVVELLAPRAQEKGITLTSYSAPDIPALVNSDGAKIRQILINLIGNGIKFTELGGVSVTMVSHGNNSIQIRVCDTGIGFSDEEATRLFEEFEQADDSIQRQHGGTGLGLSITSRLVELFDGSISTQSTPGKLTMFQVDLPIDVINPAKPLAPIVGLTVGLCGFSGFERDNIIEELGDWAVGVHEAETPRSLSDKSDIDLLLVNAVSTNPVQTMTELRTETGWDIPATIFVEPGNRAKLTEYLDAGFKNYLVKPIRSRSLYKALQHSSSNENFDNFEKLEKSSGETILPKVNSIDVLNIVLADDNPVNMLLARSALEKAGHNVTQAMNGSRVLELMASAELEYDVILLDLHMPDLDGFEVAARLQTSGVTIPVLAVTADVLIETRERCRVSGFAGYLTKPVSPVELVTAVQQSKQKNGIFITNTDKVVKNNIEAAI